jgi:hypothetical protein
MRLVVIESPYGKRVDGTTASPEEIERNVRYLRACIADSFARGEAPFASHGLYPGALDDAIPEQRRLGMHAGFEWGKRGDARAVYCDLGITPGMTEGIRVATEMGQTIEHRHIAGWVR